MSASPEHFFRALLGSQPPEWIQVRDRNLDAYQPGFVGLGIPQGALNGGPKTGSDFRAGTGNLYGMGFGGLDGGMYFVGVEPSETSVRSPLWRRPKIGVCRISCAACGDDA